MKKFYTMIDAEKTEHRDKKQAQKFLISAMGEKRKGLAGHVKSRISDGFEIIKTEGDLYVMYELVPAGETPYPRLWDAYEIINEKQFIAAMGRVKSDRKSKSSTGTET
ncbi:MAG: hypothetical protein WC332_02335 [Clostridia bacterium]|jgi:hypothetical protein